MEILNFIFVLVLTLLAGWFVWESSVMISEKKARQKAGTHDYYDNVIEKQENERNRKQ